MTKTITVISIITVLLNCAENVQNVLIHTLKSLNVFFILYYKVTDGCH